VFWALKFSAPGPGALGATATAGAALALDPLADAAANSVQIARLLGGGGAGAPSAPALVAAPAAASRFGLVGVVAGGRGSVALITTDGKAAKPYRVGAAVDTGLLLQSVTARAVKLGPSMDTPATVTLELPVGKK
jgi:general secretion pathway protein C